MPRVWDRLGLGDFLDLGERGPPDYPWHWGDGITLTPAGEKVKEFRLYSVRRGPWFIQSFGKRGQLIATVL